ncbi:MAG TPA: ABC transporter permease subunit [Thermoanaerobaculia bacterium]|nr:ABC transporter permease subunit [Thermoanaerobaculia bacterium]
MASLPQELPGRAPAGPPARLKDPRRWVRRSDRVARAVITIGGLAVIVAVLLILLQILAESLPLWRRAEARQQSALRFATAENDPVLLAFPDPYRESYVVLRSSGLFQQVDRKTARVLRSVRVPDTQGWRISSARRIGGRDEMALGLEDGRILLVEGKVRVEFGEGGRIIDFSLRPAGQIQVLPEGRSVRYSAAAAGSGGSVLLGSSGGSDLFLAWMPQPEESDFPGQEAAPAPVAEVHDLSNRLEGGRVTALSVSETGLEAVAATDRGFFLPITIGEDGAATPDPPIFTESPPAPITAAAFLLGGQSVVFGDARGRVSSWFRVRSPENPSLRVYRRIHVFDPMASGIVTIGISTRNKSFTTADARGNLWLRHNTSERTLAKLAGSGIPPRDAGIAPQGNGLFVVTESGLLRDFDLSNLHPETTLKTLFGKVWYEGYDRPEFVWQSTGGTDDFEPKFSLTPLIYGTLKATFYALLFAIPTAIAAALYASLFAPARVRRLVKPVVEIMAALPSVVIGFLAGLWLAPRVERATAGTLLLFPLIPLVVLACALAVRALPRAIAVRITPAREMAILVGLVVFAVWLAYSLGPVVERVVFGGDFKAWLFSSFEERYDPRNSLVIGFAMGFAVIPIIFTISEDAFSNVPAHLSAASLALGASRWQTAVRVVLPTASPGVFSAVMVGFGRAVGETMIVLMATGNTPIMDWSIFNGMRTLSANIAVEIPEAPFGGTLYRILFLASALLFVMTFAVNTAAEIVRQRLRRKYEFI